ncbi:hypothetical protein DAPPUDRAFT_247034 [Daphnia pulex]|uniref:Reverse transcriptase domain-containing protein n=1 Tax=Daphnia pulex TaxID=6669 RepID=E9GRM9_DAPPU|nr:hypothetical protein DAPPUDRAFT_247034 [Daphnia pulex]|eukprot:EFX77797.1 hypothetical protein DAPPUDRAFT_247034 [Daphnia pulex]
MVGLEMVFQLLDDTVPYYVNEARPIPFVDRMEVKQLLNDYVEQGLIAPVEEASEWAAPPVVLRHSNGKWRIVVNHTRINHFVRRPTHPT